MVYRRRRYKRRRYIRRGVGALSLAVKAIKGVRYIKGLVNSELMVHNDASQILPSTTGVSIHLTDIAQGDANTTRHGNQIKLKYIKLRMTLLKHATPVATFIRCLIVVDKQQEADTTPAIGNVLTSLVIDSAYDPANIGRFRILYDRVFTLVTGSSDYKFTQKYIKLNMSVRYNGVATSDIQKNGVYIMFLSDEATNTPTVNYNARLRFRDN